MVFVKSNKISIIVTVYFNNGSYSFFGVIYINKSFPGVWSAIDVSTSLFFHNFSKQKY